MACSDNVVRAGLTPKFIDTETLLQMLNYEGKPAEENKYQPTVTTENGSTVRNFTPPIADFAVTEINVSCFPCCTLSWLVRFKSTVGSFQEGQVCKPVHKAWLSLWWLLLIKALCLVQLSINAGLCEEAVSYFGKMGLGLVNHGTLGIGLPWYTCSQITVEKKEYD